MAVSYRMGPVLCHERTMNVVYHLDTAHGSSVSSGDYVLDAVEGAAGAGDEAGAAAGADGAAAALVGADDEAAAGVASLPVGAAAPAESAGLEEP